MPTRPCLFLFYLALAHIPSLLQLFNTPTKIILCFMCLEMGGAHPLAREPNLLLDMQVPVNLLDVRVDVIGDHIVLVLVDLRMENPESDTIYLVDWEQGRMTLVSPCPLFFFFNT